MLSPSKHGAGFFNGLLGADLSNAGPGYEEDTRTTPPQPQRL
jgi:hypothetical protein